MKTNKQNGTQNRRICAIALIAIITLAVIGCGGGDTDTPETFTVTFHANGGTPEPQTKTVNKGDTVNEPSISKANNTLDGWYTESGFTTKWNFAATVTANIELYAKWIEHIATINPFEDLQLTVKGNLLTPAEWGNYPENTSVAKKIEELLKVDIEGWSEVLAVDYAKCKFIIVEKTTAYTKWKTIGDGETIYINFGIVGNNQALSGAFGAAMYSMDKAETVYPCCPNGLHLVGETCCNSENCICDKDVAGQRVEGIAVTNRDNVANFAAMVTNVTTALGWFSIAQQTYIKNNIKEIKVVVGTGGINPPSGGVFTIGNDCSDDDIFGTLETWVDTNMQ